MYLLRQMFKDIVFSSAVWWDFWWVFKLFGIKLVGGEVVRDFDMYIPATSIFNIVGNIIESVSYVKSSYFLSKINTFHHKVSQVITRYHLPIESIIFIFLVGIDDKRLKQVINRFLSSCKGLFQYIIKFNIK